MDNTKSKTGYFIPMWIELDINELDKMWINPERIMSVHSSPSGTDVALQLSDALPPYRISVVQNPQEIFRRIKVCYA